MTDPREPDTAPDVENADVGESGAPTETVPAVVIEAETVIVNETAGAGDDDGTTHGHTDTEEPT